MVLDPIVPESCEGKFCKLQWIFYIPIIRKISQGMCHHQGYVVCNKLVFVDVNYAGDCIFIRYHMLILVFVNLAPPVFKYSKSNNNVEA